MLYHFIPICQLYLWWWKVRICARYFPMAIGEESKYLASPNHVWNQQDSASNVWSTCCIMFWTHLNHFKPFFVAWLGHAYVGYTIGWNPSWFTSFSWMTEVPCSAENSVVIVVVVVVVAQLWLLLLLLLLLLFNVVLLLKASLNHLSSFYSSAMIIDQSRGWRSPSFSPSTAMVISMTPNHPRCAGPKPKKWAFLLMRIRTKSCKTGFSHQDDKSGNINRSVIRTRAKLNYDMVGGPGSQDMF